MERLIYEGLLLYYSTLFYIVEYSLFMKMLAFKLRYIFVGLLFLFNQSEAKVITTIKPLAFIVAAITENVDETDYILPDGASPHDYLITPKDLLKMKDADLIIWVGPELEGFMNPVLNKLSHNNIIELSAKPEIQHQLKLAVEHEHEHEHGEFDMHIWLSPDIMNEAAKLIHAKLVELYPEEEQLLNDNLIKFQQKLKETKENIAKNLNSIENKPYFVFHNAYHYFESEFHLNNVGSIAVNPSVQPGVKKIYEIREQIKNNHVACVFSEPQFDPRIVNKITTGTSVKINTLDPLGINIPLSPDGYFIFLQQLSDNFKACLQ